MDWFSSALTWLALIVLAVKGIPAIIQWQEEVKAVRLKKEAEEADAKFQRESPEAWKAKELIKLEKERLAAEKELAMKRIHQDNVRNNAGLIAGIGRGLGWW